MIRYSSSKQLTLEGFTLPFGGKLNPANRWVKWSEIIPWDDFTVGYYKTMSDTRGRPGKDARMVIGALIIKHKLTLSDEETVLQIQENPYLQYFIGFSRYKDEPPFAASLFVDIRKRMGQDVFISFEWVILEKVGGARKANAEPIAQKGKLTSTVTFPPES